MFEITAIVSCMLLRYSQNTKALVWFRQVAVNLWLSPEKKKAGLVNKGPTERYARGNLLARHENKAGYLKIHVF